VIEKLDNRMPRKSRGLQWPQLQGEKPPLKRSRPSARRVEVMAARGTTVDSCTVPGHLAAWTLSRYDLGMDMEHRAMNRSLSCGVGRAS
jgi:hypothetical protein